ncbi:hypothetical protein CVT25_000412 [Psilocybe cyanescens]|uniref:GDT1 family protein n=1 Tax=Psilocybe cyanescens TaxID=93625 RepID=A0A409WZJ8_PSICY|nr:hypothetical protein CVT25_000412 [Psilocybe cyanescens]
MCPDEEVQAARANGSPPTHTSYVFSSHLISSHLISSLLFSSHLISSHLFSLLHCTVHNHGCLSSPQALLQFFLIIIISELSGKTVLIAAILTIRHRRLTIFLGAFLSLLLISFPSASLGHVLPTLILRRWTQ